MLTVIITSYKEAMSVGKAIQAFLPQLERKDEILVAAPDEETLQAVRAVKDKRVHAVQDKGKGKPAALNLLFGKAKGDILILSDGDVFVEKNAVRSLLEPFRNPQIGAITGRPVSLSPRHTLLGYWSHLLTDVGAHNTRLRAVKRGKFLVCSGYLYAIRKGIINVIPEDALSDDAVISTAIWMKGWKIAYTPSALVYVHYPKTFEDWILQKRRSTGGYTQLTTYFHNPPVMRSFSREILGGIFRAWLYPKSLREAIYTLLLFPMRLYLWLRIYWDIVVKKKTLEKLWVRVESTK